MKSVTLTRHLHSSDAPVCMFHTDYIIREYLFSIWIGSFETRHFALYRYVFFHIWKANIKEFRSFMLKFTETEMESASCLLSLFYKRAMFLLLLWVQTNKRRVFTDSKGVLLLSVWAKEQVSAPAPPSVLQWALLFSSTLRTYTIAHISLG